MPPASAPPQPFPPAELVARLQAVGVFVGLRAEAAYAVTRYRLPDGLVDFYYGRDHLVPEYLRMGRDAEPRPGA